MAGKSWLVSRAAHTASLLCKYVKIVDVTRASSVVTATTSTHDNQYRATLSHTGGAHDWEAVRQEGQDTYFPSTIAEVSTTNESNLSRDHPPTSWREPPGKISQQQDVCGSTVNESWRRAGSASIPEMDRTRGSPSGSTGKGAADGIGGAGAGLTRPANRGVLPAAAAGVHWPRVKQS